jgi:hypothetical protein
MTDEFQRGPVVEYGGPDLLRPGDVVDYDGGLKIVIRVNESRAVLTNISKRAVKFTDSRTGKDVGFTSVGTDLISISPMSEIKRVRRLGAGGLDHWIQHREIPE